LTGIFHLLIIASFLLSLNGCGYKGPPYYQADVPQADENVKFIIEKKHFDDVDNNESCN